MGEFLFELWDFLKERKKFWLLPIIVLNRPIAFSTRLRRVYPDPSFHAPFPSFRIVAMWTSLCVGDDAACFDSAASFRGGITT